MLDILENINILLEKKESFCLATILFKAGSAPREAGTKMIVKNDFSIIGTIGGGILEALTIKSCKDVFENKCSIVKYFSLSNNTAASYGMVCGGKEKVLVEFVDANNPSTVDIYTKSWHLKEKCTNFVMITKIGEEEKEFLNHDKWICGETTFYGSEVNDIQIILKQIRENFKSLKIETLSINEDNYLIEPILGNETVYIFGAGHVSQKLAMMTKMVDFKTVILDDRREFANKERFKDADDIIVLPSFDNVCEQVEINKESYIIIVTRGHAYDKDVLAQALKTNAKYIGMIGSKTKVKYIFDKLLEEGFLQQEIDRTFAPIGLSIYAQTPEEIAVSITAEMIKIRRGPKDEKQN